MFSLLAMLDMHPIKTFQMGLSDIFRIFVKPLTLIRIDCLSSWV